MWIQTFDEDGLGTGAIYSADGAGSSCRPSWWRSPSAPRGGPGRSSASRSSRASRPVRPDGHRRGGRADPGVPRHHRHRLAAVRAAGRRPRVPRQPGADPHRNAPGLDRASEAAAALDIGHDLGRAILNARTFEREHQLVEELQALDTYKSQLIATVSHELKNPLTSIIGHLEMLESLTRPDRRRPHVAGGHGPRRAAPAAGSSTTCCCSPRSATRTTR